MSNVSRAKISEIASLMTKKLTEEAEAIKDKIVAKLSARIRVLAPKDVQDFYVKHPDLMKTQPSFLLKGAKGKVHMWVHADAPPVDKLSETLIGKKTMKELIDLAVKYHGALDGARTMRGRIKCTLESLKTVKRIKDNFPEAHQTLLQIEGKPKVDSCDDVEKLRAELKKG